MNHPKVNLLKKGEQRYQGIVGRRFMYVSMVVTPLLIIAIISGIKLLQYNDLQSDLEKNQEVWRTMEPRLAMAKGQQRGLQLNRKMLDLIKGWRQTQVPMEKLLLEIQTTIPENIQLTRVSIRGKVETSVYRDVNELGLSYRLNVQGVSQGAWAEDAVIKLRRDLLKKELLAATFDSVKLTAMRKGRGSDGENLREFSLEGLGVQSGAE